MNNLTFIKCLLKYALVAGCCFIQTQTQAVTGRHPTGVNVNTNGVSTVHITYHNLAPGERPAGAFWCGDVTSTGVVVGSNPCVDGTLLGHLPQKYNLSRITGDGTVNTGGTDLNGGTANNPQSAPRNLTDIMSIPPAVIRRAYQEAQRGRSSEFYYIRQFINNGVSTYVTVTCRLAGGGARVPLSLNNVRLDFKNAKSQKAVHVVTQGEQVPTFAVEIKYNGSGLLKGRWEVVMPGDVEPSNFDLLSEASLPVSERSLQKRYKLISRFQKFLTPTGRTVIKGPDPKLLPNQEKGLYRILFRVEASKDKEGNTDTLSGVVNTGGVAGFPMPSLRYFVGSQSEVAISQKLSPISLLLPQDKQRIISEKLRFQWYELSNAEKVALYKIEFFEPRKDGKRIASALLKPGTAEYKPAKKLLAKIKGSSYWRVVAIDSTGKILSTSAVRKVEIVN